VTLPGRLLREALAAERPLQVVGAVNAFAAIMAERAGFRALYLSGAGVSTASFGLPDLGMTTRGEVLEDVRRITGVTSLPLIVDADTGWGSAFGIARTVKEMIRTGAAGMHIEDQVATKRCGQRPGKVVVSTGEMADRVKAAVDAKTDRDFIVIARTDAVATEGIDASLERARVYRDAGADMIFPEALSTLEDYRRFVDAVGVPVLANITEFGVTPLFSRGELAGAGVSAVLYPLSAFRAMNAAASKVYREIREKGTQRDVVGLMQSREELYDLLRYYEYEQRLDRLYPGHERRND
jgi:methylisocitrate lyase